MKQYKAYSFQRTPTSSNSTPPPSSSPSPPFHTPLQTDSFKLSFTNNQSNLNSSSFTPQFSINTPPSNPKETYENKLAQLELRITNLERTFRIFETFLSPHPKQTLSEITKDIYSRLQSIENSNILNSDSSYNNIDQLILDKIAPIKLSLYQNLNEVKGTVTQLTELHIKQSNDIVVIQKTLGQFKSNMDVFSKDLYELTQSVNQILEFVSNEGGHERNRHHNDMNNNESFVNETNNNNNYNHNVFMDDYVDISQTEEELFIQNLRNK